MAHANFLEHVPFGSCVDPSFWHKLTQIKLDIDKLEETGRAVFGHFTNFDVQTTPLLEIDSTAFNSECDARNTHFGIPGKLFNKNTVESFKECDKSALVESQGGELWRNVQNGNSLKNPSLLNAFFVLSFADLKKYHYYYWFAFPSPANVNVKLNQIGSIHTQINDEMLGKLYENYLKLDAQQKQFFLVHKSDLSIATLDSQIKVDNAKNLESSSNFYFAFADPCTHPSYAGWPIKNFIALLLHHCPILKGKSADFISLRSTRSGSSISFAKSLLINLTFPEEFEVAGWIGWERNERGKLGPRMSNMKSSIDPKCLAETSVDLNLKLMKWRLLPDIDLEKIKRAKCLLLGSGTLGCSVARVLLGWGVRKIDFVDNSTVSYSNPVRQSLFTYDDAVKGRPKSEAAAANLKNIFPGVESTGYQINIPMPGHPVGESLLEQTKENVDKLTELISRADLVFLLMDSRESRWLPTVLAAHQQKLVVNAALGFDTYLVMRHGIRGDHKGGFNNVDGFKLIPGRDLGCYFCNDVTAPGNSLRERTLDQQCTVTRPGVSQIAGALAAELAISLLQHEHGAFAPAFYKLPKTPADVELENECLLGIVPHSIRGFLSSFTHVLPATERYGQCIACSEQVLNEYKEKGFEFLLRVFHTSKHLEDLTGLSEIYNVEQEIWDLSDLSD